MQIRDSILKIPVIYPCVNESFLHIILKLRLNYKTVYVEIVTLQNLVIVLWQLSGKLAVMFANPIRVMGVNRFCVWIVVEISVVLVVVN